MVKQVVTEVPVMTFLALRFLVASAALAAVFGRDVVRHWRTLAGPGLIVGLLLWGGYYFQTEGLQFTQASRAGFITGLSVVFVPVLSAVLLRHRAGRRVLAGVALALAGMALLFLVPAGGVTPSGTAAGDAAGTAVTGDALTGDLLVLVCALFFALHITVLGRYSAERVKSGREAGALATLQVGTAASVYVLTVLAQALAGGPVARAALAPREMGPLVIGAVVLTGLLATAGAFLVQTAAQRETPPTHTALILASEPVFAALFGWLLLREILGPGPLAGCLMILAGMVLAELPELGVRRERRTGEGQAHPGS